MQIAYFFRLAFWSLLSVTMYTTAAMKSFQIENEYGNMESSYGQRGKEYVKWAAKMALGLGAGVPWVMCKQVDAPGSIVRPLACVFSCLSCKISFWSQFY